MDEIQIRWKDESQNKYALKADNIHEIYPSYNCEYSPFITKQSNTELYIQPESVIKIINSGVHKVFHTKSGIAVDINDNIDTGSVTAGTTYYTYICDEYNGNASFIVSTNSVTPSGYITDEVKQIGRFNTTTGGYIDQASMWDISCGVEKFIYVATSFYVATTGNDTTGDGSSGAPWATVGKAISYLNGFRLNAIVTINVAAGHYTESEISISHLDSYKIRIVGASYIYKTISSVQSNSGSAGSWTTIINLNNVTDVVVGDYVALLNCANGTNPRALSGFYRISNVDSGNNRITVENKSKWTSGPSGAITGDAFVYKSILQFNSTRGFTIYSATNTLLNRIALINIGSMGSTAGIFNNPSYSSEGTATLGYDIGISGFYTGIRAIRGGSNVSVYNINISNTNIALRSDGNATITIPSGYCSIAGNTNGVYAMLKGYIAINIPAWIIGNTDGICAFNHSLVYCANAIVSNNAGTGMLVSLHGVIYGDGAQCSNNTYNYYPAVNTEGNISSYIRVP